MEKIDGWEQIEEGVERMYVEVTASNRGYLYRVRTLTLTTLYRKDVEVGKSTVERVTVTYVPESK